MPTLKDSDAVLDQYVADQMKTTDANNVLYQIEGSWDYDPGPDLGKDPRAALRHQLRRRSDQPA